MKKFINYTKEKFKKIDKRKIKDKFMMCSILVCVLILNSTYAYAGIDTSNLNKFDEIIGFLLALVTKLGMGCSVYGGIEIALSFKTDSPEQKDKGIKFLLAGVGLICVGASASYFTSLTAA